MQEFVSRWREEMDLAAITQRDKDKEEVKVKIGKNNPSSLLSKLRLFNWLLEEKPAGEIKELYSEASDLPGSTL